MSPTDTTSSASPVTAAIIFDMTLASLLAILGLHNALQTVASADRPVECAECAHRVIINNECAHRSINIDLQSRQYYSIKTPTGYTSSAAATNVGGRATLYPRVDPRA